MNRHLPWACTATAALPLCFLLSACGGGGDSHVASVPPPPVTPPPPPPTAVTVISGYSLMHTLDVQTNWLDSPATRNGNYDLLGRLTVTPQGGGSTSSRTVSAGEFRMATNLYFGQNSGDFPSYSLTSPAGILPGTVTSLGPVSAISSWDINQNVAYRYDYPYSGDFTQALGQRLTAFDKAADGTETQLFSYDLTRATTSSTTSLASGNSLRATLTYDIGNSYVSMGEWSWRIVDLDGKTVPGTESGQLLFASGERTPASGIPVSGTATYDARSLLLRSSSGALGIPFTLTADFGVRTIAAQIDQDFKNFGIDDPIQGIHVSGSAPFSNDGSFDIALAGTVNYSYQNQANPPPSQAATGEMNGAFFRPQAEQVGGTFFVQRSGDQQPLLQDAFVGQQRGP